MEEEQKNIAPDRPQEKIQRVFLLPNRKRNRNSRLQLWLQRRSLWLESEFSQLHI